MSTRKPYFCLLPIFVVSSQFFLNLILLEDDSVLFEKLTYSVFIINIIGSDKFWSKNWGAMFLIMKACLRQWGKSKAYCWLCFIYVWHFPRHYFIFWFLKFLFIFWGKATDGFIWYRMTAPIMGYFIFYADFLIFCS